MKTMTAFKYLVTQSKKNKQTLNEYLYDLEFIMMQHQYMMDDKLIEAYTTWRDREGVVQESSHVL
tara:strand:- start:873 stop:1067 length:195 start_codon:yes stop_codon:yes gene_type:complete